MAKTDRQKSVLESAAELGRNGKGFYTLLDAYDPDRVNNEGFAHLVPEGLVVRRLGEYPSTSDYPMAEFLIYDPTRVDVVVEVFEGKDETAAVERAYANLLDGYRGEIRPFRDHFTVWGQRPALIRAETTPSA